LATGDDIFFEELTNSLVLDLNDSDSRLYFCSILGGFVELVAFVKNSN
jgi:hypothetical protein